MSHLGAGPGGSSRTKMFAPLLPHMPPRPHFAQYAAACVSISFCILIIILSKENHSISLVRLRNQPSSRFQMLWDLEEGGPTAFDDAGENYNPVVLDDTVSRAGYPSLNNGWQRWGCANNNVADLYPCSNLPGRGHLDVYGLDSSPYRSAS